MLTPIGQAMLDAARGLRRTSWVKRHEAAMWRMRGHEENWLYCENEANRLRDAAHFYALHAGMNRIESHE